MEQVEPKKVQLVFDLSGSELQAAVDAEYLELAATTHIAGFRKGKVPLHVIRNLYPPDEITRRTLNDLWEERFTDAVKKYRLRPISQPKVDITKQDAGFRLSALIEIVPRVPVEKYAGLAASVDELPPPNDERVAQELKNLKSQLAQAQNADRPAGTGDYVKISKDEKTQVLFLEEGNPEAQSFVGKKAGDTVPIQPSGEGQAPFEVRVEQVLERLLPPDEEVVKRLGFNDLGELRERILRRLEAERRDLQKRLIRHAVLEEFQKGLPRMDLPESLVDEEVHARYHEMARDFNDDTAALDKFLHEKFGGYDKWEEATAPQARAAVLFRLALDEVAEMENLKVFPEELDRRYEEMAGQENLKKETVRRRFEKTGMIEELQTQVLREKVMDFIVEHARIEIKEGGKK